MVFRTKDQASVRYVWYRLEFHHVYRTTLNNILVNIIDYFWDNLQSRCNERRKHLTLIPSLTAYQNCLKPYWFRIKRCLLLIINRFLLFDQVFFICFCWLNVCNLRLFVLGFLVFCWFNFTSLIHQHFFHHTHQYVFYFSILFTQIFSAV